MTAFPSYKINQDGYSVRPRDGSNETRADSGKLRIRRLYGATRFEISFRLFGMSGSDVTTLQAFYETNKNSEIEWTDPFTSVTYDVLMTSPPYVTRIEGPWAEMSVDLEGTAQ
jgi:hypothetical protein